MTKKSDELEQLLREPNKVLAVRYALELAETLSITTVVATIGETVGWEQDDLCDQFIEQWMETLTPFEKLAAAEACISLYDLALVATPHAQNRSYNRVLAAAAGAARQLPETLNFFAEFAGDHPDYSFDGKEFFKVVEAVKPLTEELIRELQTATSKLAEFSEGVQDTSGE